MEKFLKIIRNKNNFLIDFVRFQIVFILSHTEESQFSNEKSIKKVAVKVLLKNDAELSTKTYYKKLDFAFQISFV